MLAINYKLTQEGDLIFTEDEFIKMLKYRIGYEIEGFQLLIGGGIKLICSEKDREFNRGRLEVSKWNHTRD